MIWTTLVYSLVFCIFRLTVFLLLRCSKVMALCLSATAVNDVRCGFIHDKNMKEWAAVPYVGLDVSSSNQELWLKRQSRVFMMWLCGL